MPNTKTYSKSLSASRPNADEKRKPGQPRYEPVEQAADEEIAQAQRQNGKTDPADEVPRPVQVSGEDQEDSDELGEEQWTDEDDNDGREESAAEKSAREPRARGSHPTRRRGENRTF